MKFSLLAAFLFFSLFCYSSVRFVKAGNSLLLMSYLKHGRFDETTVCLLKAIDEF